MRAIEFITESLSRIVYHYTGLASAANILKTGEFQLSSSVGARSEENINIPGYPYFLSTTRPKVGGYHEYVSSGSVMFVLDGNWYNQNYKSKSVDYWGNRNPTQSHHKDHEAEDRIFSKTPSIPIDGVSAIHILVTPDSKKEHLGGWARTVIINAKKRDIQVYLYDNESNFRQLDPSKSVPIANNPLLKGPQHIRRGGSRSSYAPKGYLYKWVQLIAASAKNQLATDADKLRYSIIYNNYGDTQQGLANDMSNARKPSSGVDRDNAVKIIDFMRKNRINTLKDLVELLTAKWKRISDEDNQNKTK